MKALNGPYIGKDYSDVPDETNEIVEYYLKWITPEDVDPVVKVVYKRTEDGWVVKE